MGNFRAVGGVENLENFRAGAVSQFHPLWSPAPDYDFPILALRFDIVNWNSYSRTMCWLLNKHLNNTS